VTALLVAFALAAPEAWAAARDARTLYNTKCALCHGRDGKSNPALKAAKVRNFNDSEWQKERSDEQLRRSIEAGKEGTLMRAFKDEISAEEITGLIKVIRAFAPPAPKESPPAK
jgi:cytochrome c553